MNNVCTSRNTLAVCVFVWIFAWSERGVHGDADLPGAIWRKRKRGREAKYLPEIGFERFLILPASLALRSGLVFHLRAEK